MISDIYARFVPAHDGQDIPIANRRTHMETETKTTTSKNMTRCLYFKYSVPLTVVDDGYSKISW